MERPNNFEEMKACAVELSKVTAFLRVDFMVFGSYFYFGELTLFPASGAIQWKPQEWDETLGGLLKIPALEGD